MLSLNLSILWMGDFSPLEELATIANRYEVALIVDEAHATGVYGNKGEGRVQALGLQDRVWQEYTLLVKR